MRTLAEELKNSPAEPIGKMRDRVKPGYFRMVFEFDYEEYTAAEALMKERGTSMQTYLSMQVRAYLKTKVVFNLHDRMPFGKYSNEIIESCIRTDPRYMLWAITQAETRYSFSPEAYQLCQELNNCPDNNEDDENGITCPPYRG